MSNISYKASESPYRNESWITTGLPKLDGIIGRGVPRGRITEVVGNKSTGKTTLALTMIHEAQKNGLKCVFADVENSLNFQRAKELGVELEQLTVLHGSYGEEYLDAIEEIVTEGKTDMVFIDSLAALSPRVEAEGTSDQHPIGAHARMVARFLRKIILPLREKQVALIIINHVSLDIMSGQEKSPGGKALEYYKSVQIHMRLHPQGALKQGERQVGNKYILKIKKNKVSAPFRECEVSLLYDSGYSVEHDLLEEALLDGRIVKRGNTFFQGETKIGIGTMKASQYLKDHPL